MAKRILSCSRKSGHITEAAVLSVKVELHGGSIEF